MVHDAFLALPLDRSVPLAKVPRLTPDVMRNEVLSFVGAGCRIAALFGCTVADRPGVMVVIADPEAGLARVAFVETYGVWEALTPDCPQAEMFERELAEQTDLVVNGHSRLKPVRRPPQHRVEPDTQPYDFDQVSGDEVHEVAVGPVHAGVIEPGHFRFQCHGEKVLHLEIVHGYQHRGVEAALVGGPGLRTVHVIEATAGDTTVGHTTAYCRLLEMLGGTRAPVRAEALRAVGLELERIANHAGDLGAMSGDVGYLPASSFLGRLRGDVLNLTAGLCGNRFGRGLVRPGGTAFDADADLANDLADKTALLADDICGVVDLMWESPSVRARFEGTGALTTEAARILGLVGPAARAAGLAIDARADFPTGFYRMAQLPTAAGEAGDCQARAQVRWLEIKRSADFVQAVLRSLPAGEVRLSDRPRPRPEMLAVTTVEGWRGEVWHAALTDDQGRLARYKIVDPSFHNWPGLALCLRGEAISDFPLCNKSFNLSYCGFDL